MLEKEGIVETDKEKEIIVIVLTDTGPDRTHFTWGGGEGGGGEMLDPEALLWDLEETICLSSC